MSGVEAVVSTCPGCGKPVTSYWHSDNSGCESCPEYLLVADAVFHSECWPEAPFPTPSPEPGNELAKLMAANERLRKEADWLLHVNTCLRAEVESYQQVSAPERIWRKGDAVRLKTMRPFEFFGTVYEQNGHAVTVVYDDNKLATFHADDLVEQESYGPAHDRE